MGGSPGHNSSRRFIDLDHQLDGVATVNAESGCLKDVDTARLLLQCQLLNSAAGARDSDALGYVTDCSPRAPAYSRRNLERAKDVTRHGKYTALEYARFADDLVILVDAYRRHDWLVRAVNKRLREELAKLEVEVNEEKTRLVDLTKDEGFGFLGFDFRRVQSLSGTWRAQFTPKLKKRTALLRKLADVFQHSHSQPAARVVARINPIVRGWVNYFAIGHSGRCFSYVRDWVEMKMRRHLLRNQQRRGFGWQRRRRAWLHGTLGLFGDYRVRYYAAPTGVSVR